MPVFKHSFKADPAYSFKKSRCGRPCSRLHEVVGDEVRALEEQKNVAEAVTLQGAVQRDPVGILEDTHARVQQQKQRV